MTWQWIGLAIFSAPARRGIALRGPVHDPGAL